MAAGRSSCGRFKDRGVNERRGWGYPWERKKEEQAWNGVMCCGKNRRRSQTEKPSGLHLTTRIDDKAPSSAAGEMKKESKYAI